MKKILSTFCLLSLFTYASAYAIVLGPPVSSLNPQKLYHSKHLAWSKAKNPIQKNAIMAMNDQDPIYICSSNYKGDSQVGELSKNGCVITYAGSAITQKHYRILTGSKNDVSWQNQNQVFHFQNNTNTENHLSGAMPKNSNYKTHSENIAPVIGGVEMINDGYEKGESRTLYICRALYKNSIRLGKVVANNCNIAVQDKEVMVPNYQVLFVKV